MEILVTKLLEVGFYDLLIFIISLALFYGILKKVKLFEDSPLINAALAFAVAFLIFGFPIIMNYSLILPLSHFFTTSFVFLLVFMVGILIAAFFYPDLPAFLKEHFTSRTMISVGMAIGVAIALLSGAVGILYASPPMTPGSGQRAPFDINIIASATIIFGILLIVAGSVALQSKK